MNEYTEFDWIVLTWVLGTLGAVMFSYGVIDKFVNPLWTDKVMFILILLNTIIAIVRMVV